MLQLLAEHKAEHGDEQGVLRLNNDDYILKTCERWAARLNQAGKQYSKVVVITEDTGMLAKAKHEGKVSALRVRELPTTHNGLKELLFDRGLLASLPSHKQQGLSDGEPQDDSKPLPCIC